ncbi:hypothetical protein SCA05_22340 [Staphylococcus carnosus]|nr:hypothetical protein SCA05_22340 [Staphylococcus carnosus]
MLENSLFVLLCIMIEKIIKELIIIKLTEYSFKYTMSINQIIRKDKDE